MENETKELTDEEVKNFFEVSKELWNTTSKIYSLVDNHYENDDRWLNEKVGGLTELETLNQENTELKKEKEKLIKKAIGYMYNGVLVDGEISCRKGEVYRFRCQYSLNLQKIKHIIERELFNVEKKLSNNNLEILEFLLSVVDEEEKYSYRDDDEKFKEMNITPTRIAQFGGERRDLEFFNVQKIRISNKGELKFYEDDSRYSISVDRFTKKMLVAKLNEKIRVLAKDYLDEETKENNRLKEEVAMVKKKASNLLLLAEIDKIGTNQNE